MDAIALLKNDHRTVKELFRKFKSTGERAYRSKRKIVDQIIAELSVHAAIEEQLFYPTVRERAGETEEMVLESLEEHHVVKWTLWELERTDPKDERFDPKVSVLIENVTHHMQEEEGDLFKRVRKAVPRAELARLGDEMQSLKKIAPKRPHPKAPDEPPGNLFAGPVAAAMDAGKNATHAVTPSA